MLHSQVAHRWFNQIGNKRTKQNAYSCGSMFYEEKIIYSYGYHFPIAIRLDKVVLFNFQYYSNSTSKHQSHTRWAIDNTTHTILEVPLISGNRYSGSFNSKVTEKEVFKYIDFDYFVRQFEGLLKKLGKAKKPSIYTNEIIRIQKKLELIFSTFRGSKTYAKKNTKGLTKLLNFEFSEEILDKLKKGEKVEAERRKKSEAKRIKDAKKDIYFYENNMPEKMSMAIYEAKKILGLKTLVKVKNQKIHTSQGMTINLNEGLRVFNLWKQGKALGVEITTQDGHKWSCSKANGVIKFGCHEVQYDQAERVLTPYL